MAAPVDSAWSVDFKVVTSLSTDPPASFDSGNMTKHHLHVQLEDDQFATPFVEITISKQVYQNRLNSVAAKISW